MSERRRRKRVRAELSIWGRGRRRRANPTIVLGDGSDTGRGQSGGSPFRGKRRGKGRDRFRSERSSNRVPVLIHRFQTRQRSFRRLRIPVGQVDAPSTSRLSLLPSKLLLSLFVHRVHLGRIQLAVYRGIRRVGDIFTSDDVGEGRQKGHSKVVVQDRCSIERMSNQDQRLGVGLDLFSDIVRDRSPIFNKDEPSRSVHR